MNRRHFLKTAGAIPLSLSLIGQNFIANTFAEQQEEDEKVIILNKNTEGIRALEEILDIESSPINKNKNDISDVIDRHTCSFTFIVPNKEDNSKPVQWLSRSKGVILHRDGWLLLNYHFGSVGISSNERLRLYEEAGYFTGTKNYDPPHIILCYHAYTGVVAPVRLIAYFKASPLKSQGLSLSTQYDLMLGKVETPKGLKLNTLPIATSTPNVGETLYFPDKYFQYKDQDFNAALDSGTFSIDEENKTIRYVQNNPNLAKARPPIFYVRTAQVKIPEPIPKELRDYGDHYGYSIKFHSSHGFSGVPMINEIGACAGIIVAGWTKSDDLWDETKVAYPADIRYLIRKCVEEFKN